MERKNRKVIIIPAIVSSNRRKVVIYARVSTNSLDQAESLENQTSYYHEKIMANPDYEFVGVFADRGCTGTKDSRPEFQKMMTLCRAGAIDLILVK